MTSILSANPESRSVLGRRETRITFIFLVYDIYDIGTYYHQPSYHILDVRTNETRKQGVLRSKESTLRYDDNILPRFLPVGEIINR